MLVVMESSNPRNLETWLETLTDREHLIFDKGWVQGVRAMLEEFTDARIKILTRLAELDEADEYDKEDYKKQLLARLNTLDIFERQFVKRAKQIEPTGAALSSPE